MALLEARGLQAQYGWTKVLHGIDFAVEEGGITTILGANGAGKTTTLRAVCGMVRTAGEIRFAGQRINGRATEDLVRLGIGHAPEGRGTFVNLTVEENLRIVRTINREERVSVLLVEQNAAVALGLADRAYLMETGRVVMSGPASELRQDDAIRRAYLGY